MRYEKWKKTNDAQKRVSIISNDISESDTEEPAMDDFDELDEDGWEFDTVKYNPIQKTTKTTKISVESTVKVYTRNPETLPLVRMFMTAEQKAAEAQNQTPPKYVTESPPPDQLDEQKTVKEKTAKESPPPLLTDQSKTQQESLLNHTSARLVPGASPRNLMNSPVSKLVPLSRSGSTDGGKPMIRARSHSEQRTEPDMIKMPVNVPSPLARRVRSATTLRPSDDNPLQIDFDKKVR